MSLWHHVYFFPGAGQVLQPSKAIDVMEETGLSFEHHIYQAVIADADGHLEFVKRIVLDAFDGELQFRLNSGEQFLVECRNAEIFFACCFGTQYVNPFISFGWSRSVFARLEFEVREKYWSMLRKVARACHAAFVIIVNDPPDYFEDRFLEVDGQRVLEKVMPSGNEYDIVSVWVDDESMDPLPVGIDESVEPRFTGDFFEYSA